jgi:methionyl-tRNA formyltransferase
MFAAWQTDLILAIRFSHLFKANILRIPRLGAYNVHPGALPAYAGLWSPIWAILHGEKELGCTVHAIDEGIDTGPVYSLSHIPFKPERSVFAHIGELYMTGLASVLMLVQELERGGSPALTPQDRAARGYYSLPGAEELAQFMRLGVAPVAYDRYQELLGRFLPKAEKGVERRAAAH